jgi:hypothetical protein
LILRFSAEVRHERRRYGSELDKLFFRLSHRSPASYVPRVLAKRTPSSLIASFIDVPGRTHDGEEEIGCAFEPIAPTTVINASYQRRYVRCSGISPCCADRLKVKDLFWSS